MHFFSGPSTSTAMEEIKKPPKKGLLTEACQSSYQLDQDCKFERLMNVLEQQQQQQAGDVDPEVNAFINGIAFSLQKSSGQQCEHLFADIRAIIYDVLYPKRITTLDPENMP